MPELTIYDSQGVPVDAGRHQRSDWVEEFFYSGGRCVIDTGGEFEVTLFFRAKETPASRAEQYYVKYETRSTPDFSRIIETVTEAVENRGWELVRDTDDMMVFNSFGDYNFTHDALPGGDQTRSDLATLVKRGGTTRVTVGNVDQALSLIQWLNGKVNVGLQAAIADDATSRKLSEYDLAIGIDEFSGLTAVGSTKDNLNQLEQKRKRRRRQMRGEYNDDSSQSALEIFGVIAIILGIVVIGAVAANSLGIIDIPFLTGGGNGDDGGTKVTLEGNVPDATWIPKDVNGSNMTSYTLSIAGNKTVESNTSRDVSGKLTVNAELSGINQAKAESGGSPPSHSNSYEVVTDEQEYNITFNDLADSAQVNVTIEWVWEHDSSDQSATATESYQITADGSIPETNSDQSAAIIPPTAAESKEETETTTSTDTGTDTPTPKTNETTQTTTKEDATVNTTASESTEV